MSASASTRAVNAPFKSSSRTQPFGFEKTLVTSPARENFEILKSQKIQFMGNGYMSAYFFDHDFAVAEFSRRTDNT